MIGIIPSGSKTYEVAGFVGDKDPVEGQLYADSKTGVLFYYTQKETRSCPATGYFPVWDGTHQYMSSFSKQKYLHSDVISMDLKTLSEQINPQVAQKVIDDRKRTESAAILEPARSDGDNMFTQCIKGVIQYKKITMIDLYDAACPPLTVRTVDNYYASLCKIKFMRLDKWHIWTDVILHVRYVLTVYRQKDALIQYRHPEGTFDIFGRKCEIAKGTMDPFKRVILTVMQMENIKKNDLRSGEVDDYTINNMMTNLSGKKAMSSQLFSRFMRMAHLSYTVDLYEQNHCIFQYKE